MGILLQNNIKQRMLCFFISMVLCATTLVGSSMAWFSGLQSARNIFTSTKQLTVELVKKEINADGHTTDKPVANAGFTLYTVTEEQQDDGTTTEVRTLVTLAADKLKTDAEGKITLDDLSDGSYVWVENDLPDNYAYPKDKDGKDVKEYYFTVGEDSEQYDEEDELIRVTAYNQRKTGSLTVTKKVQDIETDRQFKFKVTFSEKGTYTYTIGGGAVQTLGSDGVIYLKNGETATFAKLPAGIKYTVTEDVPFGYTDVSTDCDGNIVADSTREAVVVNQFNPTGTGSLIVKKTINGDAANPEDKFTFKIDFPNGEPSYTYYIDTPDNTHTVNNGGEIVLKGGQQAVFTGIPVGQKYTVTETGGTGYIAAPQAVSGQIIANGYTAEFVNTKNTTTPESGRLNISKAVVGVEGDISEFTFTVQFGDDKEDHTVYKYYKGTDETTLYSYTNNTNDVITLKNGENVTFVDLPIGTVYTVTEAAKAGYYQGAVTQNGVIADASAKAKFVNEKQPKKNNGTLEVTKKVVNAPEEDKNKEFSFTVRFDGAVNNTYTYQVYTLDDANNKVFIMDDTDPTKVKNFTQNGSFTLKDGQTAVFTVPDRVKIEVVEKDYTADGYMLTESANSLVIIECGAKASVTYTNTKTPRIDISGTKTWDMSKDTTNTVTHPDCIVVTLKADGIDVRTEVFKQGENDTENEWHWSFKDLPKMNGDKEIVYTVVETPIPGYVTGKITGNATDGFAITNTYIPGVTIEPSITIYKEVLGSPATDAKFTFYFKRADNEITNSMPAGTVNGVKEVSIIGTNKAEIGTLRFDTVGEYHYTISEKQEVIEGYTFDTTVYNVTIKVTQNADGTLSAEVTYESVKDGVTAPALKVVFQNSYTKPGHGTISIPVTKRWDDNNDAAGKRPDSVQIQLTGKDAEGNVKVSASYTLNADNGWTHTWVALDDTYTYTVTETAVNNYVGVVSGNQTDGFIITNTYKPGTPGDETVTINGAKIWKDNSNAAGKRPNAITIYLVQNGKRIKTLTVTANDGWKWSWIMPEYDENAQPYSYAIEEAPVLGYSSIVEGYNVKNTYNTSGTPDKPDSNTPQTGDNSNMTLWFTLMILSIIAMRFVLFWHRDYGITAKAMKGKRR